MPGSTEIRIGTRGSKLALWQANWVKTQLESALDGVTARLIEIKTRGDKILDVPLAKVGGKGLFVKEIEEALLNGSIDIAVHSMKDMPSDIPEGLKIGAVPLREHPGDVLITANGLKLADLPPGTRIGTSSLRRAAQLLHSRPHLTIVPLRGNLDTRLRKLDQGEMDGVILAAAGIIRLGLASRITEYLDPRYMLPAVGQGALAIEIRAQDKVTASLISPMNHTDTRIAVSAERAFLARLEGGCQVPIAAHATLTSDQLTLNGLVAEVDGTRVIRETLSGPAASADAMGIALAEQILARGANDILARLYGEEQRDADR